MLPASDREQSLQRNDPGWWLPASAGAAVLVAVGVWWYVHDASSAFISETAPAGQSLYVASKLSALIAVAIVIFQLNLGLMRRFCKSAPLSRSATKWHAFFGITTLGLLLTHVVLFFLAASLRTGELSWQLFVPRPTAGYYELGLSLGLLSLILIIVTVATGWLNRYARSWARRLHWLSIPAVVLACIHASFIGSEQHLLVLIFSVAVIFPFLAALLMKHSTALSRGRI